MLAPVPPTVPNATFESLYCSASPTEFLLSVPEIASYHVRNGVQVVVEPAPGASLLDVRGFLLGNIFAVLCHQRRLIPLHASAVRIGEGVVAFLGNSGAGKSTLAAYLAREGYPLVADDICLLDPTAEVAMKVLPVAPWLKLWRSSLEALGQGTEGLAQTFSAEDKYRVPMASMTGGPATAGLVETEPLPLRAVIMLERSSAAGGTAASLVPLQPVQAITQMMKFTYQAYLLDWLGLRGEHFANCGKGIEGAQAYSCIRNWNFDSLPAVLACLRDKFSQGPGD